MVSLEKLNCSHREVRVGSIKPKDVTVTAIHRVPKATC